MLWWLSDGESSLLVRSAQLLVASLQSCTRDNFQTLKSNFLQAADHPDCRYPTINRVLVRVLTIYLPTIDVSLRIPGDQTHSSAELTDLLAGNLRCKIDQLSSVSHFFKSDLVVLGRGGLLD